MKTVITYGTFDMFHIGHLNLLKRSREMGDELIVAVSTDDFNAVKEKKTLMPFSQRAEIISALRCVNLVIPETDWDQKIRDVKKYEVDTFVIGDDWEGEFDFLSAFCKVVYLERTSNVSTSTLKESLSGIKNISKSDLISALEILDQLRKDLD